MQVPIEITFKNSEPSKAIQSEIERQAARLDRFNNRITSCHVTVTTPATRHRHGDLFSINIRIAMPQHKDILVTKTHVLWRCSKSRTPRAKCAARSSRMKRKTMGMS